MPGSASEGGSPAALRLLAPAKINLALEVTGRRPDGYHEIDSVITTIDLADEIRLWPHAGLEVRLAGPRAGGIDPADDLSGRAAVALAQAAGRAPDVLVEVTKRVPVAAGLGGGSSDAAAVLRGLNALWNLDWPIERLAEVAAALGSDVPFFLHGGAALCLGRGERIEPLPPANLPFIVLLCPDIPLDHKTAALYSRLPADRHTRGALTFKLAGRIRAGGDIPPALLYNAFDDEALQAFPGLAEYRDGMLRAGAESAHLSGTGPSLYALFSQRPAAVAARALLAHARGWRAYLVEAWRPDSDGADIPR